MTFLLFLNDIKWWYLCWNNFSFVKCIFSARINNLFEAFNFAYIFSVIIYLTNKGLLRSLHISSRVSHSCQMSSNLNDAIFYGKGISWDMRRDINKNFIFSLALTRLSLMSFCVLCVYICIYMEHSQLWRSSFLH